MASSISKHGGFLRDENDIVDVEDIIARDPIAFQRDPRGYLEANGCVLPTPTTLVDAKQQAKERSKSIFANWKTLRDILDRHEDVIRKRWSKKGRGGREKIMTAAWPGINREHRPDRKAMVITAKQRGLHGPIRAPDARFREACLLPHLNVEDLAGSKAFLVLLQARARNAPDVFAFSDYHSAQLGVASKCINPRIIEDDGHHFMRLVGSDSYGTIFTFPEDAEDTPTSVGDVKVEVGELILEIQDRTLDFLVKCAQNIMHDIEQENLTGDAYPILPPLPVLARNNSTEIITIPSLAEEGPYRVPHAMDFDKLLLLIEAKRSECENHMWTLREDPGYFFETATSRGEHRQESVYDDRGEQHPTKGTPVFWDRVLTNVAQEAYSYLMSWTTIQKQVRRIAELDKQYREAIQIDKPLPEELEMALLTYKEFLELAEQTPLLQLCSAVPGSPEMRMDWIRDRYYDPQVCKCDTRQPVLKDELLMLFTVLQDDQRRKWLGLQNILDDIERLIRRDPKQKQRISPMVALMFSDLALVGELERQLKLYQPRLFEPLYQPRPGLNRKAQSKAFPDLLTPMMKVAEYMDKMEIADLGTPFSGRFDYPADERPTKQRVDQMRSAEENLDKFWAKVDRIVLTRARGRYVKGQLLNELSPSLLPQRRTLRRTQPWVEPPMAPPAKPRTPKPIVTSAADANFELELRTQRTIAADEKPHGKTRTKPKTRGTADPNLDPSNGISQSSEDAPKAFEQIFRVNMRAYKVFINLFHDPSSPDRPGEIPWQDFLYAMGCMGFMCEKLYGSVWQFTPTKLDVERAINIHEPHPHAKIPYRLARRHGRRLNRTYGWSKETFRLE